MHGLNFLLLGWCLESSELQPDENKVSAEKFPKRKLKTPAQLKGLEKFYTGRDTFLLIHFILSDDFC